MSQGPANATLKPSGGMNGSYKMYEMMRIQGSMRGLHGWLGRQYNTTTEDGEIVWTLEENRLQKSGLPREFTFVMLLTKGSGGYEGVEDVKLELDIKPVVGGFMGISNASFPGVVNNMLSYRPLHNTPVDLDYDVGQRFQPEEKGLGFNFAKLASDFDDFVWLPGQTWSTSEHGERGDAGGGTADDGGDQKDKNAKKQPDEKAPQQQQPLLGGDNTLNLRLILDHSTGRGSPAAIANAASLPYISLRPQQPPYPHSRGPSPLHAVPAPSSSVRSRQSRVSASGSTSTSNKRRSITITSTAAAAHAAGTDNSTATPDADRRTSRSPTLRRRTSRSSLGKEYNSPPPPSSSLRSARPNTIHDPYNSRSPHAHFPSSPPSANSAARPSSWYRHDDSDGLEAASHRPPPRTADSNASSQATVVRHTVHDSALGDHGGTAAAKNSLLPDAGGEDTGVDVPIERRRSAASGRSGRSARSGRSDGTNGRVSVRQAKVAQTPYPATPTPTSASAGKGRGEKGEGLRYGDEESNDEGDRGVEEAKEAAQRDNAGDVIVDVPKLAVPRKSSKRASVGSQLRYVVEAGPTAPAVPLLPNGEVKLPVKVQQPEKIQEAGKQKIQQQEGKEQPEKEKQANVVSFNGALQGDGKGWTVNDLPHDDSAPATASATSTAVP
ncbi:MAG: hypothetical protein INR71_10560, partial [Terriglobus roseus]|nr:hypothetical protein [Terriglobus roseus]